jgi:hypothetical protein
MKTPRPLALLFALLGAASCDAPGPQRAAEPAAAPIFDQLIVPGKRIGPISVGMSTSDVLKALGEPTRASITSCKGPGDPEGVYSQHCATKYGWANGLQAEIPLISRRHWIKERVYEVTTKDPRYATSGGVKVGSSELSVRAIYGPPTLIGAHFERITWCYLPGMILSFVGGKVVEIDVGPYPCR